MFGFGKKQQEPQEPDRMGRLPAWYAAMEGRTEDLARDLKRGVDINHAGQDKMSLLSVAAYYGHSETVEFLLANGADPNLPDGHGNGPLWHATREASMIPQEGKAAYDKSIVALLLKNGADAELVNKAGTAPPLWAHSTPELQQMYRDAGYEGEFKL